MPTPLDRFLRTLKKVSIVGGSGAIAALYALELALFKFPPDVRLYLSYFFSITTVICIFCSGGIILVGLNSKISDISQKLKELDGKDEKKV